MEKETCELCHKEYPRVMNKCLRTLDGHLVCVDCNDIVFKELFKGVYTFSEAYDTMILLDIYDNIVNEYLKIWRTYALFYKDTADELLSKLYKEEERVSMLLFNRSRQVSLAHTITHIELLRQMDTTKVYPPISDEEYNSVIFDVNKTKDYNNVLYFYKVFYNKYMNMDNIVSLG